MEWAYNSLIKGEKSWNDPHTARNLAIHGQLSPAAGSPQLHHQECEEAVLQTPQHHPERSIFSLRQEEPHHDRQLVSDRQDFGLCHIFCGFCDQEGEARPHPGDPAPHTVQGLGSQGADPSHQRRKFQVWSHERWPELSRQ